MIDEVDRFPMDLEGSPIDLLFQRTTTFAGRRKIFLLSTPTHAAESRIEQAWREGDMRRYHVPCPHCGAFQVLVWEQIRWPGEDRRRAFYVCCHCGEAIQERQKQNMVAQGRWIAIRRKATARPRHFICRRWPRRSNHGAKSRRKISPAPMIRAACKHGSIVH